MERFIYIILFSLFFNYSFCQDFKDIEINSIVTEVQPMTGIVFWTTNSQVATDAISLEYSYMSYADIIVSEDNYDWSVMEELLNEVSSRNHQAILRFRFSYPGRQTTVPQYIKDLSDYNEVVGKSEGQDTWFPDWTHPELEDMTLKFYKAYANKYDNDPRLAFVQVGFGLWGEYHIYDGPFRLGETFPSKDFQKDFFTQLDQVFKNTYWSISIDAADNTYSPFVANPSYKDISFGLFDDSFMHENHGGYNTSSWNFFNRERYKISPAGGEFSYYTNFDQENVLNEDIGAHGVPYEVFAQNFHISYINGNDQPAYQSMERIKEASMASGYKFKLLSVKSKADSTIIKMVNLGVAPIYVDAFLAVNGIRCSESLKLLPPNEIKTFYMTAGSNNPNITIESDDILDSEEIQYFGTINDYFPYGTSSIDPDKTTIESVFKIYPTITSKGRINIEHVNNGNFSATLFDSFGKSHLEVDMTNSSYITASQFSKGIYFLVLKEENGRSFTQKIILQ